MDTHEDIDSLPEASPQPCLAIPPGYSIATGPEGIHYVVPTFLLPATELALETEEQKPSFNVRQGSGGVRVPLYF
jgi:hypothetical protein